MNEEEYRGNFWSAKRMGGKINRELAVRIKLMDHRTRYGGDDKSQCPAAAGRTSVKKEKELLSGARPHPVVLVHTDVVPSRLESEGRAELLTLMLKLTQAQTQELRKKAQETDKLHEGTTTTEC